MSTSLLTIAILTAITTLMPVCDPSRGVSTPAAAMGDAASTVRDRARPHKLWIMRRLVMTPPETPHQ
ncbi:hypothetical protein [Micromonospora matsumotoense]|uniref:hypothetical protein n=1 Tax=Micromonospora matsumotoense TaxID=121616 RepID=UPI003401C150